MQGTSLIETIRGTLPHSHAQNSHAQTPGHPSAPGDPSDPAGPPAAP
jgi:hypothetical protein